MAEGYPYGSSDRREDTDAPQNPPNSVEPAGLADVPASAAGVAGMWYVLGPVILLVVVLGIGLYFWSDDPDDSRDEAPIGTAGDERPGIEP